MAAEARLPGAEKAQALPPAGRPIPPPASGPSRWLDLVVAACGLFALSPLFLILAAWIKLDSPGPLFHRGLRAGRGGVPFRLFKFRSMVANAERSGPAVTAAGDARITRAGRFLRHSKLDELPQLINVLRGEMALVGPRPEALGYVSFYNDEQRGVLSFRPGITSPASLVFRHEESLLQGEDWEALYRTQIMPVKVAIDLAYMQQHSLRTDLQVIAATFKAL
jgi:lipopolysaccharide/colanic/teichoic acid biosynthesis glycosyltransferase